MDYSNCPNCGELISGCNHFLIEELLNEIKTIKAMVQSKTKDHWLDMRGICTYTSLSESTIRRAVVNGTLKCSNVTGKLMFKVSWIDHFLEGK